MKRVSLILAVCLSMQLNALSAPFVHVHADTGHDTDHHDGRAEHRHLGGHDAAAPHHRGDIDSDHHQPSDSGSADVSTTEPAAQFLGGVTAARAGAITFPAEPVSAFSVLIPNLAAVPMERQGPPVTPPPDSSPPPLRGPPR